jgi:hypothetical protein
MTQLPPPALARDRVFRASRTDAVSGIRVIASSPTSTAPIMY